MVRRVLRRRTPLTTLERRQRSVKQRVVRAGVWLDPFPGILGTLPEKMVYAELSRRQIPFIFQSWFNAVISVVDFNRWYRPDFIIPDAKIIIEVQGFYWHSQPDVIENDAFKYAVYEQLGYTVISWWDFDIYSRIHALFAAEPRLLALSGTGGRVFTGNEEIRDDSAGIKTLNRLRTDYGKRQPKYRTRRNRKKGGYSYGVV